MAKADFNEFRFDGLNHKKYSNQYMTMSRVSADEKKIVVKVADEQVLKTKFGYALILDDKHVVFVKDWAVDKNWYGCEVLLTEEYFNVKEWGDFPEYEGNEKNLHWQTWLDAAKEQDALVDEDGVKLNRVKWKL